QYDLSEDGGFLPARCLRRLPPAYDALERLVEELPALNREGALCAAVDGMEELAPSLLAGAAPEELRRLYLLLGMLGHSYVHGRKDSSGEAAGGGSAVCPGGPDPPLPAQLSRPWLQVCCLLRMPPVLTAAATDLWNWQLKDLAEDSLLFVAHMVPCAMQRAAARVVPRLFLADLLVRGGRGPALAALLGELAAVLRTFLRIFQLVGKLVDVGTFYNVYRPLLDGFYPGGIVLCGISADAAAEASSFLKVESVEAEAPDGAAVRVRCKGPSAGQSTMFILFDAFLCVEHDAVGADFQTEMLSYMPEQHRHMVAAFRRRWQDVPSVREFVHAQADEVGGPALAEAYRGCVSALRSVRQAHLATVTQYLASASVGTGASQWRAMLQATLESTARAACIPRRVQ
ncbi:unnamed protein product, partial [Prorocentrum cordatum]